MRRSVDPGRERVWRSAWILTVAGEPLRDGALVVRDGRVAQVGPAEQVLRDNPGLPVEDRGDEIIVPGLVDAHCHLEWSLLDGLLPPAGFAEWLGGLLPLRMRMLPGDYASAARLGALRALEAGTTTLADSGPTGAGAAALAESGLRGLVHLEAFGRETGADALHAAARTAEGVAALDAAVGPRGRAGVSPHAPYTVGPELWAALRAHPGLAGRPWATHLAESADEESVIATGEGPLGALFAAAGLVPGRWEGPADAGPVARLTAAGVTAPGLVAAHCVRLGGDDPGTLARAGIGVAHCPRSNVHLRCGRAPIEALRAAGVAVGLGTDSPASGGDYDLRAEARACREAHDGRLVLDDDALLRLITLDAARVLGLDADVGHLRVGARADLTALQPAGRVSDPRATVLDAATTVRTVVVDGEVLLRDGTPTRIDPAGVRARAAEARGRLC
jgi:cytosine/adenosine deaminase-related metal-dependent hydrolase